MSKYEWIKSHADKTADIAGQYFYGCIHQRNHYLVDYGKPCDCYLVKRKGRLSYTGQHAKEKALW